MNHLNKRHQLSDHHSYLALELFFYKNHDLEIYWQVFLYHIHTHPYLPSGFCQVAGTQAAAQRYGGADPQDPERELPLRAEDKSDEDKP